MGDFSDHVVISQVKNCMRGIFPGDKQLKNKPLGNNTCCLILEKGQEHLI